MNDSEFRQMLEELAAMLDADPPTADQVTGARRIADQIDALEPGAIERMGQTLGRDTFH